MNTLVADLMQEAIKAKATVESCEKYVEQMTDGQVSFCKPDHVIHVFSGIDRLADMLEAEAVLHEYDDRFAPYWKTFKWEEFEFFQLSEKDGSFR